MKILIFGPSGSGKSYISSKLKDLGINAIDADSIEGLSNWYNWKKEIVDYPVDADEEFLKNHQFLWDKNSLEKYLKGSSDVYIFGSAGNLFDMLDLFDKSFFLKVDPELQKKRLTHETRENPMGMTEYQRENAVRWGLELERKAKELGIPFIDATLSPEEIHGKIVDNLNDSNQ